MSKIQQLREIFDADPDIPPKKAAKRVDLDYSTACRYIRKFKAESKTKINHTDIKSKINRPSKFKKAGGSLEDFKERYDDSVIIPRLIREGIEKHLTTENGEPKYLKDVQFREACGVQIGKWRRYADDFKELQVSKNQEIYWGHPDIIEEMRMAVQK